jgi:MFS family permease
LKPSAIWFLTYAATMAAWTFVPIMAKEDLGIGDTAIGLAVLLYSVSLFASSYVFGRASDVHGRRRYILGGLLLGAGAMATHYLIDDVASLWIVRLATGCAMGVYPAALVDYIARSSGLLGRFSAWGSLGWGVGALAAGVLAAYYGDITWVFLLASCIYLVSFLIALVMPPIEHVPQRVPLFPRALIRKNLHYYVPMLVRHTGAMSIWTFWPLFLIDLGANYVWVGIIQFINPLVQFVFMWAFTDRVRSSLLFPVGLVLSAVTMLSFTFARDVWELLPTQVLLGVSWGCTYVGALRAVTETADEKATAAGVFNSTTSLSAILGPLAATFLVSITNEYESTMYFAAAMAALSLVLHYVLKARVTTPDVVSSG